MPFTCLVVEDSAAMRQLIVDALRSIPDMTTLEAGDGLEALRKLAIEARPDLIVTDIIMPVMDGLKLVRKVRSDSRLREIPIVIITTESGAEDRARALALGANDYLTKPVEAGQLVCEVKRLLRL